MTTIAAGALVPATQINQWCPPGALIPYAGTVASVPSGWLLCDGASYLRTDYPDLFAAIGTTYGAADGTHFNVPDLRGRVIAGHAASGGHTDVATIGNNDGLAAANRRPKHRTTNALTAAIASHFHNVLNAAGANVSQNSGGSAGTTTVDGSQWANNTFIKTDTVTPAITMGGSIGTNNANDALDAPAYIVMPYIIRAKDV